MEERESGALIVAARRRENSGNRVYDAASCREDSYNEVHTRFHTKFVRWVSHKEVTIDRGKREEFV